MAENMESAVESTTVPQESETVYTEGTEADQDPAFETSSLADAESDSEEGTTPSEEGEEGSAETHDETEDDAIEYRFNHETKKLSRKEAPAFIQKLLKSQSDEQKNTAILDRIRFLAHATGKDLGELITDIEQSYDQSRYRDFLKKTNNNETIARELANIEKQRHTDSFRTTAQLREEAETQEKEALTERMGRELQALQAEFPEIRDFSDLPVDVVETASDEEISLFDSYLRYLHRNAKKAAAQKSKQEKAAAGAVGSLRGAPDTAQKVDEHAAAFSASFRKHF